MREVDLRAELLPGRGGIARVRRDAFWDIDPAIAKLFRPTVHVRAARTVARRLDARVPLHIGP